jgi:hypothetical protein
MTMKWCGRWNVRMLSTLHSDDIVKTGKPDWKPKCIVDYSRKMGAADRAGMLLSYVRCICKSVKWYKKLVLHILDIALLNALYLMQNGEGTSLPGFKMSVIRGLLEKHTERRISSRGHRCSSGVMPRHLTDHHLPDYVSALLVERMQ